MNTYGQPTPPIPLTKAQYGYWTTEIDRAQRHKEDKLAKWDVEGNLKRYAPEKVKPGEDMNDGSDFADSERKKSGLFYSTPYVTCVPDPDGNPSVAVLHQEFLNTMLDEQKMNAKGTALKAIQACLIAIQPSPTKIGYVPTIVMVDSVDPMTQQPVQVPQVVHEEFFWSKISERAQLLPVDLHDNDYDRAAPWLGYKFRMKASLLKRTYTVPPEWKVPQGGEGKIYFNDEDQRPVDDPDDPMVTGTYLEYKASLVDPTVSHPGLIRCLVLVDGSEEPVKHEDASWLIDPITKQFNPASGFEGFSIHPLALRDLPDSAYIPADSTITAQLTSHIADYLTDTKRQQESNRLVMLYDSALIDTEAAEKIQAAKAPAFIPVIQGALSQGVGAVMAQVASPNNSREHYEGLIVFQSKREQILGMGANQFGKKTDEAQTATESQNVQRNTEARFEQERQKAIQWYLAGVRKVSTFLVRYGDRMALEVLGQQRGQAWAQARNQGLLNRFAFAVQIDGGKYMDIQADRADHLKFYNLTAQDPNTNRIVVLKKMAAAWGLDPAEWIVEKIPEKKPDPPKVSISLSGDQFNPALPQFPILIAIARQGGFVISEQDVQLAQQQAQALAASGRGVKGEASNEPMEALVGMTSPMPTAGVGPDPRQPKPPEHPGAAEKTPRIDQHGADLTGNLPGNAASL